MPVVARDLLRYQAAARRFLPETVTNLRTGTAMAGRVSDSGDDASFRGMRELMRLRRWDVDLDWATSDVAAGDLVAVAGMGTYYLYLLRTPITYPSAVRGEAVLLGPSVASFSLRRGWPWTDLSVPVGYGTHLASIAIYQPFGRTLNPIEPQFLLDAFGATAQQPAVIYVQTLPYDAADYFPFDVGDLILIPGEGPTSTVASAADATHLTVAAGAGARLVNERDLWIGSPATRVPLLAGPPGDALVLGAGLSGPPAPGTVVSQPRGVLVRASEPWGATGSSGMTAVYVEMEDVNT